MLKSAAIFTLGIGIAFVTPLWEIFPSRMAAAELAAPLQPLPQAQIPQCLGLDEQGAARQG